MPEELLKNKLSSWDQGGTLNQMMSPSEIPLRDVMEINNWKVHKDGKSRIKRMGYDILDAAYASFNEPIRGIFKYTDPDGNEKIIIVTRTGVIVREDVYTWTRKWHDEDTFYLVDPHAPFLYQDKMCHFDHSSALTIAIKQTLDGLTWTALDTFTPTAVGPGVNIGYCSAVYADEIFMGLVSVNVGDSLISRWDGTFHEEVAATAGAQYSIDMHLWDGRLWLLVYSLASYYVWNYNGTAWSMIANYDGAGSLPTGSAKRFAAGVRGDIGKLFTYNNNLHLAVTTKDGGGKWTWEIHRFNATLYDRFNKIYDSSGVDDYSFTRHYEYQGKHWVIVTKATNDAFDAFPDGNDNKIYSSPDLITWTEENGSMALGGVEGSALHNGRMFISSFNDYAGTRTYKVWYWDSVLKDFVNEINIATNAAPASHGHGDLVEFNGKLYGFKYREAHVREFSTNLYTTIYSTSKEIDGPVAAVTLEDGRIVLGLDENVIVEGSDVYPLGLQPPVDALTATVDGDIVIDATNNKMDFKEPAGAALVATLTNGVYAPIALAAEIKTQMEAVGIGTYTVTYQSNGLFRITSDGLFGNITIDATNNKMDFEETANTPLVATLTNAVYAPAALAAEIKIQLDAAGASTYTVTYEATNKFKIVSDGLGGGGILTLLIGDGINVGASVWELIGFGVTDRSGVLTYTGGYGSLDLLCLTGANAAASVWTTIGFAAVDLDGDISYEAVLGWALTGGYMYVVTFYRSGNYPVESNPGPESTVVYPVGEKLDLSAIPVSPDPKVDTRRIYRTTAGGSIFYWLDDIDDNTTTTYEDDINDDTLLGGDEVSYDRYPPPVGKYMEVWDNRLWIAGVAEQPNFLYRTNTGTSEEMASGNFIQIRARESEVINQIIAFGDKLYPFKLSSMHRVSKMGASSYEVELLPQDIGTDAPWSVAVCDKFLIFKSIYGIEIFNGNSCYRGPQAPSMVSDLIPVTMASINKLALEKIIGSHNFADGEYWLAIPTGVNTEPDTVINLNYMKMSIALYTFPENLTFLVSTKTKADGLMFLTGTDEGNIYIQSSGYDDNGDAISSSFRTGWFNVSGEREMWNILRRLFLKYAIPDTFTLTVNIYSDFNKTADVALLFEGSTPTTTVAIRNEIMARQDLRIPGYYVSFEFVNNEKTGGEVRVSGWDAFFRKQLWQHTVEGD